MQVCLVSGDLKLRNFLSEVANSGSFNLVHGEISDKADFYVLDFDPAIGSSLPESDAWNHLYVVDPKYLSAFGQRIQSAPVCMLLKPVTRPALEAFLETFRERWISRFEKRETDQVRSDRDELLQQLLLANLNLQEYDQERTQFLARALHDLRTPLMSLRGICGLLLEGEAGPLNPQQRELLQRMERSGARLARMSSGMFELSVEGKVHRTLQLEPGNIESCVHHALEEVAELVREKQLVVLSHVATPPKSMFMESPQIEQILINLLENACRFTPRFGKIDVQGSPVCWDFERSAARNTGFPNSYRIDIKDSGPGIEPAIIEAIFEQYTSTSPANDRSGGGLGLAISKLAATAHRGRIWATPSKEGGIFSLVLPFDPRAANDRVRRLSGEVRPRTVQAG